MESISPDVMRRRKSSKKGYQLCVMVCGRSGTGKSTFINSLCDTEDENALVYNQEELVTKPAKTMHITAKQCSVEQPGTDANKTTIHLTVLDTPGFGDAIDNSRCSDTLIQYLEEQYDKILKEETKVNRNPRQDDSRVHVCLYFLVPTGRGLRELDIDLMQNLTKLVNVIPVISKCDTLTTEEKILNKHMIMNDIRKHNIPVYDFPQDEEADYESKQEARVLRDSMPFCVMGSNSVQELPNNTYRRTRQYPWRTVEVDDPSESDFAMLRNVLFGSHILELKERTNEVLYETYRRHELEKVPEKRTSTLPDTEVALPSAPPRAPNVSNNNTYNGAFSVIAPSVAPLQLENGPGPVSQYKLEQSLVGTAPGIHF